MKIKQLLILSVFVISFMGCSTVKGTVTGAAEDTSSFFNGVGATCQAFIKADKWLQENWW